MGVDWTALEEALRVSALRHAAEILEQHPTQDFYAIALHGVSSEESESIDMPLLALNSIQALERDRLTETRELLVARGEDLDEDEEYEDRADADDYSGVEAGDRETEDDSTDGHGAEDEDHDGQDLDDVLQALEADLEADDDDGFYSDKWEPTEWHWSSIGLVEEVAAEIWSDALATQAQREGWSETIRAYYRTMVRVAIGLRDALNERTKLDLVTYVADDDHAETLLKLCLTPEQLSEHFPDIVQDQTLSETS